MFNDGYMGRLTSKVLEEIDPEVRWLIDHAETDKLENWRIELTVHFVRLTWEPYGQVYKAPGWGIREISGREVASFYGKHESLPSNADGQGVAERGNWIDAMIDALDPEGIEYFATAEGWSNWPSNRDKGGMRCQSVFTAEARCSNLMIMVMKGFSASTTVHLKRPSER